jgi:DNA mismatch repair protein MutL
MPIRVLPEEVAAQIAAGEVVERPASVVKELLENALDAGSSAVHIEVRDSGRRLIRVSDDGWGIPADQIGVAFHRYSTSKLASVADLEAIGTLGFRGEALASIASVSRVTMVSRPAGSDAGASVRLEAGRIISRETVGAPRGTMVGVENLFYNVPARLKFLRSVLTERRHIDAVVSRYALAYPAVRFRLVHDGRQVLQTSGSGSVRDVLITVFGLDAARQMVEVGPGEDANGWTEVQSTEPDIADRPLSLVHVSGYTSDPALHRANRNQITLFINGRWVQDSGLGYAIVQAYHTLLMTGRYPISMIQVRLPPDQVDVNVHPTKAEVRFRDKDTVFDAVQRTVRRALLSARPVRPVAVPGLRDTGGWTVTGDQTVHAALAALRPAAFVQPAMVLPGRSPGLVQPNGTPATAADDATGTGRAPLLLRVIGQLGASYVVAEGPTGMVLIDQHAAHERVLYERYMAERQEGVVTQALLVVIPVDLTPERAALVEEHLPHLERLGFYVEPFGGSTLMVRGVPALLGGCNPEKVLQAVADDLEQGDTPLESQLEDRLIARVCKTAAVKAGHVMTMPEMVALIRQLEQCKSPHTCPHGRPTMIEMSAEQLARRFERI